ncbi:hypothetical protein LZK73_11910 [Neorhizobium galegae]|nr:hypothetical protein LZK73_11910 [Neorhizobium galegae]
MEIDAIHKDEEAAGFYDHEAVWRISEQNAEKATLERNKFSVNYSNSIASTLFNISNWKAIQAADQKSAWLSGLVPYTWKEQAFEGYTQYVFDGGPKTVSEHSMDAAKVKSLQSLQSQYFSWGLQTETFTTNVAISENRQIGVQAKASWHSKDADFQRRRTLVARKFQDLKSKAAGDVDGALNYGKRLPTLKKRFELDVRDAYARLTVVEIGLREVFGYTDTLPSDPSDLAFFDNCLIWARKATQWLIRFSRRDQNTVISVSVKDSVTQSVWQDFLNGVEIELPIDEQRLVGMRHVRMRGLGAIADEENWAGATWAISATCPRTALVRTLDNNAHSIDQAGVPPVIIGRAMPRMASRDSDIVGVSSLHNSSPIGTWVLKLSGRVPRAAATLNDCILEMHIAFRHGA